MGTDRTCMPLPRVFALSSPCSRGGIRLLGFSRLATDESYGTPAGKVGTPYSHTVSMETGNGLPGPYTYAVVGGAFPPGLTLSSRRTHHAVLRPRPAPTP